MDPGSPLVPLATTLTYTGLGIAAACLAALALGSIRVRVRVRRPRSRLVRARWVRALLSSIGMALAVASPAAATGDRRPDRPLRGVGAAAPPWSSTDGSPPPRPSVGIRVSPRLGTDLGPRLGAGLETDLGPALGPGAGSRTLEPREVHPAIHGRGGAVPGRLFPRAGTPRTLGQPPSDEDRARSERLACMERHPAGKARSSARPCTYTVEPGDTLWGIAERLLGDADARAVARYWPRIHRINRDVIGPNPDLIRPGQVLHLPPPP